MANLNRIVDVQINLSTTAITERSFSDLLIVGPHILSAGRVLVITDPSELLDLGMSATDQIYLAASASFKQTPGINRVYIGKRNVDTATVTVTNASQTQYTITIQYRDANGVITSQSALVTADDVDTTTTIATALATAVNALSGPEVTATATGASILIENDVVGADLGININGNLSLAPGVVGETIADTMNAIKAESSDFYGIVMTERADQNIIDMANWAEANESLFIVSTGATAVYDPAVTTDIMSQIANANYENTTVIYHAIADEYIEAAIASRMFTFYPGQENWANQQLNGITFDRLTEGQSLAIKNKNGNTFEQFRNFSITQYGKVGSGEWIDVIRFRHWLIEQVKVNVVSVMVNANGKIPYTDKGIQVIVGAMRVPLDLGVSRGGIAPPELDQNNKVIPSYTVSAPLAYQVPFNDKANRVLRDLKFTARLAGAINTVEIRGNLTYAFANT